jgi:uncharacterized protein YecE (DUF72 family)
MTLIVTVPARIGTAGWSIPGAVAAALPGEGSHLQRYASVFGATEINSSFHRPHRPSTYQRWAASVPPDFRFSVKVPKTITHQARLIDCGDLLTRFADEIAGLGERRGPVLVQLPPSLAFDAEVADIFFAEAVRLLGPAIVCEPRHRSWFEPAANDRLAELRVARVVADPAICAEAAVPGGWPGIVYVRLHGSPVMYRSSYDRAALDRQSVAISDAQARGAACWTIFDNTASGAALANALDLIAVADGRARGDASIYRNEAGTPPD